MLDEEAEGREGKMYMLAHCALHVARCIFSC
jgi:hypothetical protein